MEKFKVYGSELRSFYAKDCLLKEVIKDVLEELSSIGMKVVQFTINGQNALPGDLRAWERLPLSQIEELGYEAIETDEAIIEMYAVWLEAVKELDQRRRLFLKGLSVQGRFFPFEVIGDLVANSEQVQIYLADIGIPSYQGSPRFSMTARSIEAKDLSFLHVLLENDLKEYLEYFEQILTRAQGLDNGQNRNLNSESSNTMGRGRLCS